ncbi:MAG: tryptophan synthase subunit alpha [Acidobacteria bacterium]|nr:tryptophan synthase subunit alpha [Acidobacteriota bacterium]
MSGEIRAAFERLKKEGRKAFIPYVTAGDPDLDTTVELVLELERSGSAIVELGIPFSDPLADGPTIQRASERALRHGYRLADYLEGVERIRSRSGIPIVMFSYFNPILQYGLESLARDARMAGVNGLLVTDMTPEEGTEYRACLEAQGVDPIFLAAPTSSTERVLRIVACTRGFVYIISRTGVTGTRDLLSEAIEPTVRRVRAHTDLPVAVGFGISRPEHVRAVWEIAEGAVVGSAIVAEIERQSASGEVVARVGEFCRWLIQPGG